MAFPIGSKEKCPWATYMGTALDSRESSVDVAVLMKDYSRSTAP